LGLTAVSGLSRSGIFASPETGALSFWLALAQSKEFLHTSYAAIASSISIFTDSRWSLWTLPPVFIKGREMFEILSDIFLGVIVLASAYVMVFKRETYRKIPGVYKVMVGAIYLAVLLTIIRYWWLR
jgi:hypothetical protein